MAIRSIHLKAQLHPFGSVTLNPVGNVKLGSVKKKFVIETIISEAGKNLLASEQ